MTTKHLIIVLAFSVMITDQLVAQSLSFDKNKSSNVSSFTEPYRSIDVAAAEMGTLATVDAREGDKVNKGAVLGRLNEDVLQASLRMASRSKDSKGKLNSALAEFNMQQKRLQKLLGLQKRSHASQTEIDRARAQVAIAEAQVEAVRDELEIKRLELERIQAQLELRRVRSPIDGIVTRVLKDEGEFVSANDPNVFQVVQLNPLLVVFSVPQQKAVRISAGQQVNLTIGSGSSKAHGIVEFVSPDADAQSGTCRVKVRIENPSLQWQSGVVCRLVLPKNMNDSPTVESKPIRKRHPVAKK